VTPLGDPGSVAAAVPVAQIREQDLERRTAAGAVLDPGSAAVELGEAGDQGEADADPGGVGGCAGALAEGLEQGGLQLPGDTDAGVFDGEQDPLAAAGELDPHRGVGVVCRPALATSRSTRSAASSGARLDPARWRVRPMPMTVASGLTVLAADPDGVVAEPDHAAVLVQGPVLHVPGIAGAVTALVLGQDPLAVVGVEHRLPEVRLHGLLARVAEELLVLRAFVDEGAPGSVHLAGTPLPPTHPAHFTGSKRL
jgi:hypothetical protein